MISRMTAIRSTFLILILLYFIASSSAQDLSVDRKLGEEGKKMIESTMGLCEDPLQGKILSDLGQKLANQLENKLFDYQFFIVDMGEPNAFALPGGYIFATRGILALANSEDELAGVIGHEIIHSNNRHSIKQQKKGILPGILSLPQAITGALLGENTGKIFSPLTKGGQALGASYSRKDENEADKLGVALSAKSGYNPESLSIILNNLNQTVEAFTGKKEEPSYFSDHPLTADRIEKINKESAKLTPTDLSKFFKDRKEFLYFIDGLMVGPNPAQGVFQDDWFLHPEMNFKFKIPAGWLKENSSSAVAAGDSTGSAVVMLEIESNYKSAVEAAKDYAANIQKKTGKPVEVNSKTINGFNSKSVALEGQQKNQLIKVAIHWIEYNNLIFKLSGVSTPELENFVNTTIESFSKTTISDLQSITMRRIKVVETIAGENLQALSERSKNVITSELTATINGISKDKVFGEGELLKIVVQVPYTK